ncbi:hypothetical protein V490_01586 [Pseudogymnoascus sp. VKM F-3557]|nr:hypothetical protein V490_01586 [Pseudogymnoascus sp. VKM F-3557]
MDKARPASTGQSPRDQRPVGAVIVRSEIGISEKNVPKSEMIGAEKRDGWPLIPHVLSIQPLYLPIQGTILVLHPADNSPNTSFNELTDNAWQEDIRYEVQRGWWETPGLDVLKSGYFTDTRLVRRFNLVDPAAAANAFTSDNDNVLVLLPILEGQGQQGQQGNPSPAPTWDKMRILSSLASSADAANTAEDLDFYTWSKLCDFSFDSWARFTLGYDEPTVSKFVRDLSALRNDLAICFQELGQPQVWILVEKRAFRKEFTFFDDINCKIPDTYADSIVQADRKLFAGVTTSVLDRPNSQQLGLIGTVWNRLCSDAKASVHADYGLSVPISRVAARLIYLGDCHSATAILTGLRHAGCKPEELSAFWHLVDTKDNYGACPSFLTGMQLTRQLLCFNTIRFPTGGLDRPIAVEGGLEGKTGPDFDCPIAMAEKAALDLDGGLEGRTFLGIPDMLCKLVSHFVLLNGFPYFTKKCILALYSTWSNGRYKTAANTLLGGTQDAQSPRFVTGHRNENSFYGHPVIVPDLSTPARAAAVGVKLCTALNILHARYFGTDQLAS